jgi:hypothetical protein
MTLVAENIAHPILHDKLPAMHGISEEQAAVLDAWFTQIEAVYGDLLDLRGRVIDGVSKRHKNYPSVDAAADKYGSALDRLSGVFSALAASGPALSGL